MYTCPRYPLPSGDCGWWRYVRAVRDGPGEQYEGRKEKEQEKKEREEKDKEKEKRSKKERKEDKETFSW